MIWFACGENCMPVDVLRRHNLDAPSTPFSSCRSNIEHLLYFEKESYRDYLDTDYLIEANAWTGKCYLNLAKKSESNFRQGRHTYLEFTHQNLYDSKDRKDLQRRINRQIEARNSSKHIVFFYHHRSDKGFVGVEEFIVESFERILSNYKNASALCYSQKLIQNEGKKIDIKTNSLKNIRLATLNTYMEWAGHNKDVFFGRNDDDLFRKLLEWYQSKVIR